MSKKEEHKITISVAVITYNQKDTIAQTLDSVLMQTGNFKLELVIGEDCSTDNTYAICADYAKRYSDVVRLLQNTHNIGILPNTARVFNACTGDYISIIAGDDYYCDNHALAKQAAYMQSHVDVGVMAANGYNYFVRSNKKVPGLNKPIEDNQNAVKNYYFSPTHTEGAYFAPVGMMFRREVITKYIDFNEMLRRRLPVEDYPLQAILSQHTKFACLPDLLVTYRVYRESASFISYNNPNYLEYYRGLMEIRRYLNELFPHDVCITEAMMQEKMFYKEFQYNVFHWKYLATKQLIFSIPPLITETESVKKAKYYSKNRLIFAVYHFYKKITQLKHTTIMK